MPVCCYGQSWYKYQIHIVARALLVKIYMIKLWTEDLSDLHTEWTKAYHGHIDNTKQITTRKMSIRPIR